ncbi:MAG: sporulation/spore germination protein [bacterium]|nr:MAG: sporulation/spore germination protein [bacterium]
MKIWIVSILLMLIIYPNVLTQGLDENTFNISSKRAKSIISQKAKEVIVAIKNKDIEKLSTFVHPTKGLCFIQYSCLSDSNLILNQKQIKILLQSKQRYIWGKDDGSLKPIKLTFQQYYKTFLYDLDYLNAPVINYNKVLLGGGANYCFEDYQKQISVQFFFPKHPDPNYNKIDTWGALRLIFSEKDGIWYLTKIIHDTWTI